MHAIQTESKNQIRYDPQRHAYYISTKDLEMPAPSTSLLMEKRDKNGKVLTQGVTIADLEAIINDMNARQGATEKPQEHPIGTTRQKQTGELETHTEDTRTEMEKQFSSPHIEEQRQQANDNDIPLKPPPKKKKKEKGLLEKAKNAIQSRGRIAKDFKRLCDNHSQSGFTHLKLTEKATEYFKGAVITEQKIILEEFPQFKHKLEKWTQIDVSKIRPRQKGKGKRQLDEERMRGITG